MFIYIELDLETKKDGKVKKNGKDMDAYKVKISATVVKTKLSKVEKRVPNKKKKFGSRPKHSRQLFQDESSGDEQSFRSDVWSEMDFLPYCTPDDEDAVCLLCNGKYSEDGRGEEWIKCLMSAMWAYVDCGGPKKTDYICDFCKN